MTFLPMLPDDGKCLFSNMSNRSTCPSCVLPSTRAISSLLRPELGSSTVLAMAGKRFIAASTSSVIG